MRMTLEEYLRDTFERGGTIDHAVRAHVDGERVTFYIHPHDADGNTMDFVVSGNTLRLDEPEPA